MVQGRQADIVRVATICRQEVRCRDLLVPLSRESVSRWETQHEAGHEEECHPKDFFFGMF
jgi:hypothetical protein